MAGMGFGPYTGGRESLPIRPALAVGDKVRHVRKKTRGVYWMGRIVHHDGRVSIKWEHLSDPLPLSDYGYNDVRKC